MVKWPSHGCPRETIHYSKEWGLCLNVRCIINPKMGDPGRQAENKWSFSASPLGYPALRISHPSQSLCLPWGITSDVQMQYWKSLLRYSPQKVTSYEGSADFVQTNSQPSSPIKFFSTKPILWWPLEGPNCPKRGSSATPCTLVGADCARGPRGSSQPAGSSRALPTDQKELTTVRPHCQTRWNIFLRSVLKAKYREEGNGWAKTSQSQWFNWADDWGQCQRQAEKATRTRGSGVGTSFRTGDHKAPERLS